MAGGKRKKTKFKSNQIHLEVPKLKPRLLPMPTKRERDKSKDIIRKQKHKIVDD